MKNYKSFTGTVEFNGEKCQFVFNDYKLTIEVSSFNGIDPFSTNKELPIDNLIGAIATEPHFVYFAFDKSAYTANFSSRGYSAFNVVVYIKYYCVLNRPFFGKGITIQFRNNSFQKWLGVYPKYLNKDNPLSVPNVIAIKNDTLNISSSFTYRGLRYIAKPDYSITSSQVHFDFVSILGVECVDEVDYESIYSLCILLVKVVRFFFYRYFISLGDISLRSPVNIDGKTYYEEIGRFFFRYEEREIEPIDLGKYLDFGFIRWEDFSAYLPELIKRIENNQIYLYHFPEKRIDRFRTDFPLISTVSAAFECEFSRCFSKYETFKKTDINYLELKNKISIIEINDNQRDIIANILSNYFDNPSLQERAEYALGYFSEVLDEFKQEKKLNIKRIAQVFRNTRNKIDHGDLRFSIDDEIANTFYYLRITVLCMQLLCLGVEKEKMVPIIKPVLSIDCNK